MRWAAVHFLRPNPKGIQDRNMAFGNLLPGEDTPSPVLTRSARGFFTTPSVEAACHLPPCSRLAAGPSDKLRVRLTQRLVAAKTPWQRVTACQSDSFSTIAKTSRAVRMSHLSGEP